MIDDSSPIQPVKGRVVPRYAGASTFARIPEVRDVNWCDVAIVGIPFDTGVGYRPGARFGPMAIRQASRHLRPQYHPELKIEPLKLLQVADCGDVACNPFDIRTAVDEIETAAVKLLKQAGALISLGGDHTIALPLLRAVNQIWGPVALIHFDAHLDTWDTYMNAPYTHGTPFRRAAEEGLFREDSSIHVGIRGPVFSDEDLKDDARLGFQTVRCSDIDKYGVSEIIERIRRLVGDLPVYLSIDIDVLDPAFAPGTGTPELAGLTSRELTTLLRGLRSLNIISADVVEVAPAYDAAEVTALAAATIVFEIICLIAMNDKRRKLKRS